jgi:hypothetical protein
MSDEVKAAERLRKYTNGEHKYETQRQINTDTDAVVEWALPLLDETAITRETLASLGFVEVESDLGPDYFGHMELGRLNLWEFNDSGKWLVNEADWIELTTLSQLRMLCLALGIPLEQP